MASEPITASWSAFQNQNCNLGLVEFQEKGKIHDILVNLLYPPPNKYLFLMFEKVKIIHGLSDYLYESLGWESFSCFSLFFTILISPETSVIRESGMETWRTSKQTSENSRVGGVKMHAWGKPIASLIGSSLPLIKSKSWVRSYPCARQGDYCINTEPIEQSRPRTPGHLFTVKDIYFPEEPNSVTSGMIKPPKLNIQWVLITEFPPKFRAKPVAIPNSPHR